MNDTAIQIRPERENSLALTAPQVIGHVRLIQEVMGAVMKEGTHYGTIPGTPKPSLWKPGAEVLGATFRIAVSYRIEDLSTTDCVRYRVIALGTHQITGAILGEGAGEASSNEEKYKWRKGSNKEWENTAEDRRRIKYGYSRQNGEYSINQVRTEPADVANTILKMACKRAQVAMTLNVTAASDIFAQDLEDLPTEIVEEMVTGEHADAQKAEAPKVHVSEELQNRVHDDTLYALEQNDPVLMRKAWDGIGADEKVFLWKMFSSAQRTAIKKLAGDNK